MTRPEITWSIMHPTALNVEYMRRLVSELPNWQCDSFEICAACHTLLGGMDGLVLYEDYPEIAATLDKDGILANRARLKEILALAHNAGKPVYYWHREVTVWPETLKVLPNLLDANGEFDLLGDDFEKLLRYKLSKTFEAVPELDGIVLTLTEADYSVIHNSTPKRYPPQKVVDKIVRIFADEHLKRGKHFILRSFGSIAQDYKDILAGARLAARDFSFEVETKITPYDFDPFLPDNPFLRSVSPNLTLGAECDCEGEFLGFGHLPAENVENIVRFVRYGQKHGVNRYTIRLDRMGNNIFDSYPINLYAYQEAILHPELTAEDIRNAYAAAHYPASCADKLNKLGKLGFSLVEKLLFIDHIVMFHQNPIRADLKWIHAGGLFALFAPKGTSLKPHMGIWPMLPQKTIGGKAICAEKAEALAIAERGLAMVEELKRKLPKSEYQRLQRLWSTALNEATALKSFVELINAYFEDMKAGRAKAPRLHEAMEKMSVILNPKKTASAKERKSAFNNGMDHNVFALRDGDFNALFADGVLGASRLIVERYDAEYKARKAIQAAFPNAADFVITGGFFQDWRAERNMHASHATLLDGIPVRFVANPVFPNGFVRMTLKNNGKSTATRIAVAGKGIVRVSVNDARPRAIALAPTKDGAAILKLKAPVAPGEEITLIFRKAPQQDYPQLHAVALI